MTALDGPQAIVGARDGFRQTVVDLMQLVREIQVGVDVDGDGTADLDPHRIYYFGNSGGGNYGTQFAALEPAVRAAVLGATGGAFVEIARLSPVSRSGLGQLLALRTPSLANGGPDFAFNENLPARGQPPFVNTVRGRSRSRTRSSGSSGRPGRRPARVRHAPA